MLLSIIIVSFNTKEFTKRCLASIKIYADLRNTEVIVVDNGSSDSSVEMIHKQFPLVTLIENSENLGFAKANNQGIRLSTGDYILLLNSDTEVNDSDSLRNLVKFVQENSSVGAVVPRLLNSDGTPQASAFHFSTLSGAVKQHWLGKSGYYGSFVPEGDDPQQIQVAAMAAFLIPRSTIERVGFLDEGYFMYFEDFDYCRRLQQAQLPLYYLPRVSIVHHHGASGKTLVGQSQQWKRLIPGSKRYHGLLKHYLIQTILWTGQKFQGKIAL